LILLIIYLLDYNSNKEKKYKLINFELKKKNFETDISNFMTRESGIAIPTQFIEHSSDMNN